MPGRRLTSAPIPTAPAGDAAPSDRVGAAEPVRGAAPARGAEPARGADLCRVGRPRSPDADRALLRAALECLREDGYARMSMAGVAKRAGVSATTLYRRWSSKDDLVVAALASLSPHDDYPDTGSLAGDIHAALHRAAAVLGGDEGEVLRGLIGEVFNNPDLAALMQDRLSGPKRELFAALLDRAVRRGEIAAVDPGVALNLVVGPVFHRFMVDRQALTPEIIDYLVPLTVAALKAAT